MLAVEARASRPAAWISPANCRPLPVRAAVRRRRITYDIAPPNRMRVSVVEKVSTREKRESTRQNLTHGSVPTGRRKVGLAPSINPAKGQFSARV
jgi:hypothetical protein